MLKKNQTKPAATVAQKVAPKVEPVVEETATKTNSKELGTLSKNPDEDSLIDYTGSLKLDEPGDYWLHAFAKKSDDGEVYLSLSAERKKEQTDDAANADRGVLYKNNRKKLKHHADYTGNINFSTPGEFELHATIEESRNGLTYMAIAVNGEEVEVEADELPF
jgi:hypothetical protein